LSGEDDLLAEALFLRVNSYMDLGKNEEATRSLLPLLEGKDANRAMGVVYGLLSKLDKDLDAARAERNTQRMRSLASARANLSGYLVKWAQASRDPEIKKHTYRYKVFDANTKHLAAELEQDPRKETEGRQQALALYKALATPEGHKEYVATITNPKVDKDFPDPLVLLGMGLLEYDLEHWQESRVALARLLNEGKLGSGTMEVEAVGGGKMIVQNDQYWEARFKLIDCNWRIAETQSDDKLKQDTQSDLKLLVIKWGNELGGKTWSKPFAQLRQKIIPGFEPGTTTQPAGRTG
jgi:hypothetical protein